MFVFSTDLQCPKRYTMVLLTSIGMCIVHAQRVNMGVTVVTILDEMPENKVAHGQARSYLPNVEWTPTEIGFLHAVFFIGYIITQIPGGYLATKLPCHRLFGGSIMLSCGFNLLLPACISHVGYSATCLVRFIQGIAEGFLFPSCYAILWHWTIPSERSRLGALVLGGVYFGPVLGLPLSGAITHYMRWDLVYYFFGGLGVLWTVIWVSLAYESPALHPGISSKESEYIKDQQKETNILYQDAPIPWGSIMTSLPVQAINVCHFARSFALFLLITNEPAYLNTFGFGIATNGVLSAIPHLGKAALALGSGPVADHLLTRLTPTTVRKLFTCIGFGCQSLCYFLLYWFSEATTCVAVLAIGSSMTGLTVSGWNINHLDLAPRYASILVAVSTSVGTSSGMIMPVIVGYMTKNQVIEEWQNVFLLTSGILAFAVIVYAIFGSAKKQKWADPPPPEVRLLLGKSEPSGRRMYQTINLTQPHLAKVIYPETEINQGQLPVGPLQETPLAEGAAVDTAHGEGSPPEELERDIADWGVIEGEGVDGESARLSNVTTRPSRVKSDSDEIDITANDSPATDNRTTEAVVRRREPKIQ